jgi:predicted porin
MMKKTLIAGAIAGLLTSQALAQNVVLSGLVDVYAGSIQYSGDKRTAKVESGGMTTSWWGMSGTEDLGGGLKASFKVGGFFRADSGAFGRFGGNENFLSRDASVGIEGGFGKVQLGRGLAPNFLPTVIFNAFGDSFAFSPLVLHANVPLFNGTGWQSANAGDTGWSNEIIYTTPNFGGLSANVHYQFGEVAGNSGNRNFGANFLYFNGPFALGGFVHNVRTNNPNAGTIGDVKLGYSQQKAWMLSGKAGFGPANVYANYESAKNDNYAGAAGSAESKTLSLSADVAAGPGKFMAGYANTKWSTSPLSARNGSKRSTFSLGYDYILSKRTDAYAVLMNDKITRFDRGNSFAVGMRHKF